MFIVGFLASGGGSCGCGGGGGAPITDIPGKQRIPDMRMDDIRQNGAEVVAVGCPQCTAMLEGVVEPSPLIKDLAELVADDSAALRAEPLIGELDQPGIGRHLAPGSPLVLGGLQRPPAPAPLLGQHTDEVLGELLSLPKDALDDLRARRVIGERE